MQETFKYNKTLKTHFISEVLMKGICMPWFLLNRWQHAVKIGIHLRKKGIKFGTTSSYSGKCPTLGSHTAH